MADMLQLGGASIRPYESANHNADSPADRINAMSSDPMFINSWNLAATLDARNLSPGSAILLRVDDPVSFGSDTRKLILAWDGQTKEAEINVDEGEAGRHTINKIRGEKLEIWIDDDTGVDAVITSPENAARQVRDDKTGDPDKPSPFAGFKLFGMGMGTLLIGGVVVVAAITAYRWGGKLPDAKVI